MCFSLLATSVDPETLVVVGDGPSGTAYKFSCMNWFESFVDPSIGILPNISTTERFATKRRETLFFCYL